MKAAAGSCWSGPAATVTTVDSGSIERDPDGEEGLYFAVSSMFDDVSYEFNTIDEDTLCWGSEFEYYQKMA